MKTSSAKAKGRRLQQQVAEAIKQRFALSDHDVKSTPMGSQGADVWLSSAALAVFPYAIECKNTEKLNMWAAWEQAKTHVHTGVAPLVITSRNRSDTLVVLQLETFMELTHARTKA